MGQFVNSINDVRKNYRKYDEWEQAQADKRARKEYLAANLNIPQDKLNLIQKKAETVVRASEIMDTRSEDNCQNMEQLTGIVSAIPVIGFTFLQEPLIQLADKQFTSNIRKKLNNAKKELKSLSPQDSNFKIKKKEYLDLSKKAEMLSRKIKNYGTYAVTGLMVASAIGMILWGNSRQKEASRIGRFQAKQNELKDVENFIIYTPEQIGKAKEIASNIPDSKEKNNLSKIFSELKELEQDKSKYKAWLAQKDSDEIEKLKSVKLTEEQLKKGREEQELIINIVKDVNIKAEEYSENVENSYDTIGTLSWLIAIPVGFAVNKLLKLTRTNKKARAVISTMIPILIPLVIQTQSTVEEKNASRIGRYQARKDLLAHPERLIAFSDEEMEKASHIKAEPQKKSFFQKLGGSFSFLFSYLKDKKEYKKYKQTTRAENEKLQKAFKEIETTEAQKTEAKNLQKNLFTAFDEIDEMSQRYSEDVEAGSEIFKEFVSILWGITTGAAIALLGISVAKGKFPIIKAGNWLTNLTFDSKSSIKAAVNKINEITKKSDKAAVREFQKSIVRGTYAEFAKNPKNTELKSAVDNLLSELEKIGNQGLENAVQGKTDTDMAKVFSELFEGHLKQTPAAKWIRRLLAQSGKLWVKSKANNSDVKIPKDIQEKLGMNFTYQNYNTLINTGIVAALPILGLIYSVPYAFNSWLTNIQKKAGKIGIMKAMEKIDDPRVFAPYDEKTPQSLS